MTGLGIGAPAFAAGVVAAAPNGTDDTTNITAAITAASTAGGSFGGIVYLRPGLHLVSSTIAVPTNVRIIGAGKNATVVRKLNNIATATFDFAGASNASRCQRGGMADLRLDGSGFTGPLMRCKWADHLNFDRIWFYNNSDQALYLENCWDSYFNNVEFDTCSGIDGLKPSVLISGNSDDSSNIIVFNECRWENFIDGALWISSRPPVSAYTMVTGANPPYGVYLTNCKMETPQIRGLFYMHSTDIQAVHMDGMYVAARGLYTGISTGRTLFAITGAFDHTFKRFRAIVNGSVNPTVDKFFSIFTNAEIRIEDVYILESQAINTAVVSWDGGASNVYIENLRTTNMAKLFGGASGNVTYPSIASAATTMAVPKGVSAVNITGTTTITTIPAIIGWVKPITFHFASTAAMTDGGNLKLAGSITGAADTTITLYCDGTNWYEVSRSVN